MESTHIVIIIIGLGLIWSATSVTKAHFEKQRAEKLAEIQNENVKSSLEAVKFTQEIDDERMKIFADAITSVSKLGDAAEDTDSARELPSD